MLKKHAKYPYQDDRTIIGGILENFFLKNVFLFFLYLWSYGPKIEKNIYIIVSWPAGPLRINGPEWS